MSAGFFLIGIGNIAALWFGMYRLATLAFLAFILIAQLSGSVRAVNSFGIWQALLRVAPLYAYVLLSTLWSPDPRDALTNALFMCAAVVPAIAVGATLARRYTGQHIAQGLGVLLLPFVAQAIISAAQGRDPMEVGDGTMRSLLSVIICLASPILAGAWAQTRRTRFLVFGLIAAVFAVTMESRSVILFAGPAALLSLYLHDKKLAVRILRKSLLPLALAVALAGPSMLARFDSNSTSFAVGASVIDEFDVPRDERVDFDRRLTTYTAIQAFLDNPLLGRGYWSVYQIHQSEYGIELSAHGLIPGSLGELGLIGMLLGGFVVWRVMRSATNSVRSDRACDPMTIHFVVSVAGLLLLGLFHQTIESPFFGMGLALLMGLSRPNHGRKVLVRTARQADDSGRRCRDAGRAGLLIEDGGKR